MFGIKIISEKRYNHLVNIEQNFEQEKQTLLNQLGRIEKDLEPLRQQLTEKMVENNKLREEIAKFAVKKPSFRKTSKQTEQS